MTKKPIEKLVTARVQAVKAELEKQIGALTAERDNLNSRLADIQINQGVILAATKRGLRPSAIPDATLRARSVFKLDSINNVAGLASTDEAG